MNILEQQRRLRTAKNQSMIAEGAIRAAVLFAAAPLTGWGLFSATTAAEGAIGLFKTDALEVDEKLPTSATEIIGSVAQAVGAAAITLGSKHALIRRAGGTVAAIGTAIRVNSVIRSHREHRLNVYRSGYWGVRNKEGRAAATDALREYIRRKKSDSVV